MLKYQLVRKYENLKTRLSLLLSKNKTVYVLISQITNLIELTLLLDDNNQLWSEGLEKTFENLLEEYFKVLDETKCWF
jgi:hypothetical protein